MTIFLIYRLHQVKQFLFNELILKIYAFLLSLTYVWWRKYCFGELHGLRSLESGNLIFDAWSVFLRLSVISANQKMKYRRQNSNLVL